MAYVISVNTTYPENDPANARFQRNKVWVISEPNQQDGLSWVYDVPTGDAGTSYGNEGVPFGMRPGVIAVSGGYQATIAEADAKRFRPAFKAAIAYFVSRGILTVAIGGTVQTADQVRVYA